ncbi:MAG TPA: cupin domain-containing protein [Gaiellaceae bacterium]|nr:cupin domain-containing protein [Gaiellaceae bacterium]
MSWYVRNARDGKWFDCGPRGSVTELVDDENPQVGVNLFVLTPGQPMSMYHWEADQEGFLVLSGEALLIVENEERPLRAWDYFHCPPNVSHTIVGAGTGPAAILALGAREQADGDWGGYPYSEPAMKHDASTEEETTEPKVAYARFPSGKPGEFREDWLA